MPMYHFCLVVVVVCSQEVCDDKIMMVLFLLSICWVVLVCVCAAATYFPSRIERESQYMHTHKKREKNVRSLSDSLKVYKL